MSKRSDAVLLRQISKHYRGRDRKAVDRLDLQVNQGEIFGILGDNGAGKSTVAKIIAGIISADEGVVEVMGEAVTSSSSPAHVMSFMPQHSRAMNRLTVREALIFSCLFRGMSRAVARDEVGDLSERLKLGSFLDYPANRLSGGQQRLAKLALAFLGSTPLVILDEPTNDLDPLRRGFVWSAVSDLQADGRTVIFVTHDALEAERVVDRVAIMRDGRIVALGSPRDLKHELGLGTNVRVRFRQGRVPQDLTGVDEFGDFRSKMAESEAQAFLRSLRMDCVEEISLTPSTLEELYLHYVS